MSAEQRKGGREGGGGSVKGDEGSETDDRAVEAKGMVGVSRGSTVSGMRDSPFACIAVDEGRVEEMGD